MCSNTKNVLCCFVLCSVVKGKAALKEPSIGFMETVQPKVAILLCTYNGERYLHDQLASFQTQAHANWTLWVSDDGSNDSTLALLEAYKQKWPSGKLSIVRGPAKGFAANFLSLTCNPEISADYYAYSDQDDIWVTDKLERAVQWLQTVPPDVPALYCSRTRLVDEQRNEICLSTLFTKPSSFRNALMQSIAGANTMVFNHAARLLLCEAGADVPIRSHDWWTYLVVTGCGGKVYYDTEPSLDYRQHTSNLVGTNATWQARLKRVRMLMQGDFRDWNDGNIVALRRLQSKLTLENCEILERFAKARDMGLILRLFNLKRCGIYRQTFLGNWGLLVAAFFKKI